LRADRGADIAGENLGDLFALVGVHLQQAADTLGLAGAGIEDRIAGLELARVDADEDELADEGVGHDLEAESRERLVVVCLADDLLFHVLRIGADHGRNIERAGQVVDHRIEQRLHALVLEGGAAEHREDLHGDGGLADAGLELRFAGLFALEEQVENLVVGVGNGLDQRMAGDLGGLKQLGGNLFDRVFGAHGLVVPENRLHRDEIDHAQKLCFRTDLNVDRNRTRAEAVDDGRGRIDCVPRRPCPSC